MQQTTDGGYILGGCSDSGIGGDKTQDTQGSADFWILKTDALGNKQWDRDFGGSFEEDRFGYVKQTSDGGYLVSGISRSNISGDKTEDNIGFKNAWAVKTDPAGNKQWDKTALTSPDNKIEAYAIQSSDGCYEIARPSYAAIAGNKTQDNWDNTYTTPDYWIVKFCDSTYSVPVAASFVGNTFLCPGTCTGFLNLSINATNYLWSFPGGNPSMSMDVNPASICYPNPGTYDIQLIATNATSVDTLLLTDYITVYPTPLPQSITQIGDTLIANTGATSYQWFYNGNILNGATDYYVIAMVSGDYNVVATDTNNCEVEAVLYNVIAGIDAVSMQDLFQVASNPVTDKLIIERNTFRSDELKIYNLFGEEIYSATVNKKSFTVSCENFSSGIYFIRIGKATVRFIKY